MSRIKVLVVDDSALMRKIISDMINSEADMETVDVARNGEDLFKKLTIISPDVITMDVEMPVMDGITALKELKRKGIKKPVIILSSVSKQGTALTMECLQSGAFDFLPKPSGSISLDIDKVKDQLIEKIRAAYTHITLYKQNNESRTIKKIEVQHENSIPEKNIENTVFNRNVCHNKINAVAIGASTGGPKALYAVITSLPHDLGVPVFVVQHMPVGFTKAFAERLNSNSEISVVEAQNGDAIEKNVVYIAPGGYHMEVGSDKRIHLNTDPSMWGVRPAVDKLFFSSSKVYKENLMSVVLTGMGKDGANGTIEIKKNGGYTISEHQSTCTIYGMPKAAFETGMIDMVLPLDEISREIINAVKI
ncbi:MAG: chemotaxis response regulator protein-glutamate methylesterase [Clostridiaceae bacterium]|nr:chemotaxis response regulator protein-glutamate methylesterase [Clostridiaceae bacterium]